MTEALVQSPSITRVPVTIDLISDVVCPWCYVGFRALLAACTRRPEITTTITLRPFELDSTIPKSGVDYKARLLAKFGGDTLRLAEIRKGLYEAGVAVGIHFNLDAIKISPNTRDCHRLLLWARGASVELNCAEALFQAYHIDGRDLTEVDTLVAIASDIGMDGNVVANLLASDRDDDKVMRELTTAVAMGITGVPCAVFNQNFAVVGAQAVGAFVTALDTAAEETFPA